jgi:hypothetical protein
MTSPRLMLTQSLSLTFAPVRAFFKNGAATVVRYTCDIRAFSDG